MLLQKLGLTTNNVALQKASASFITQNPNYILPSKKLSFSEYLEQKMLKWDDLKL